MGQASMVVLTGDPYVSSDYSPTQLNCPGRGWWIFLQKSSCVFLLNKYVEKKELMLNRTIWESK